MKNLTISKKMISFILTLVYLIFLTGCVSNDINEIENSNNKELIETEYKPPVLPSETFRIETGGVGVMLSGTVEIKFNKIEVFDNIFDAGLRYSDFKIERSYTQYNFSEGQQIQLSYPYFFDGETGNLMEDCYWFMIEADITNIDLIYKDYEDFNSSNDDVNIVDIRFLQFSNISNLNNSGYTISDVVYFAEGGNELLTYPNGKKFRDYYAFNFPIGATQTIHLGYVMMDRSENAFTKMCFCNLLGPNFIRSPYFTLDEIVPKDEYIYYKFDASEMIEKLKNK